MTALEIIGLGALGFLVGGWLGAWWGDHLPGPDDFGVGIVMYGAAGAFVGTILGMVTGTVVLT